VGVLRDTVAVTTGVDGQVLKGPGRLAAYANFVKVAHTVFALPFTIVGIVTAAMRYPVQARTVGLAVLAFGAARFAGMGFNRIADVRIDALNPRTAGRELPSGRMSLTEAWVLVTAMAMLFLLCAWLLNPLCFKLAPVALLWICGYSFTKRFTALSHLWLGWGLAIAPVGGYLAVAGEWSTPWWLLLALASAVACWVAGFDVIYALQDEAFDQKEGLKSIPQALGARRAIVVARWLHIVAISALALFALYAGYGWVMGLAIIAAAAILLWEHRLVRVGDYSKLDVAFFTMNGVISGVVALGALLDRAL
jgi:4-hydroxybenzoate polyprenyltransferase